MKMVPEAGRIPDLLRAARLIPVIVLAACAAGQVPSSSCPSGLAVAVGSVDTPHSATLTFDEVGRRQLWIACKTYEYRHWRSGLCALGPPNNGYALSLPGTEESTENVPVWTGPHPPNDGIEDGDIDAVHVEWNDDGSQLRVTACDSDCERFDRVVSWLKRNGGVNQPFSSERRSIEVSFRDGLAEYVDVNARMHQDRARSALTETEDPSRWTQSTSRCRWTVSESFMGLYNELVALMERDGRRPPEFTAPASVGASPLDFLRVDISLTADRSRLIVSPREGNSDAVDRIVDWVRACGGTISP